MKRVFLIVLDSCGAGAMSDLTAGLTGCADFQLSARIPLPTPSGPPSPREMMKVALDVAVAMEDK